MKIRPKFKMPEKQFVNRLSTRFRIHTVRIPMMPKGVEHMERLRAGEPLTPGEGRALTPDEKTKLLETASLKPEWETACWAAILALNTTMRAVRSNPCAGATLTFWTAL